VVNASDSERDFQLVTGTVGFKRIDNVDASTPKYYSHVYAKKTKTLRVLLNFNCGEQEKSEGVDYGVY
jgi:hypothetical protein